MKNLINWLEVSRHIVGPDSNTIRQNKISKKHFPALDRLFHIEIGEWWEAKKSELLKNDK